MVRRGQRSSDRMLADLPLDDLLREGLARVREVLSTDAAVILVRSLEDEDEEDTFRVRATIGIEDEPEMGLRVPAGAVFYGVVAKGRRAIAQDDVDPDLVSPPSLRRKNARALAGVPFLSGDRLLGVLQVASVRRRRFSEDELNLLRLAAARIALGIEHTARRDAERRARESLEASSRAKDEFLAMLGHELRNPLSAVRNAVATASLDESRRPRALEIARHQADQLGRLIDDLLDVARITQGRIALRKQRVDLVDVVARAVESTRSFIESRGLRLTVPVAAEAISVEGDPARLEQVFVNLLSNAAKYTEAGGRIDVTVDRHGDEVVARVRDTGMGIAPDMLSHVWDLF